MFTAASTCTGATATSGEWSLIFPLGAPQKCEARHGMHWSLAPASLMELAATEKGIMQEHDGQLGGARKQQAKEFMCEQQ